jgi:hypothetical protein
VRSFCITKDGFAGMGKAAFPTERWLRRNEASCVPYGKMASPERDKPRSLRKDGFAGTGQAAFPTKRWLRRNEASCVTYEKMASPERDKPCSLRKDGFAGTGHTLLRRHRAAFPTKRWLRRNGQVVLATMPARRTSEIRFRLEIKANYYSLRNRRPGRVQSGG